MFYVGYGERPDYGKLIGGGDKCTASCCSYNPKISAAKKDIIYKNLSLKSRIVVDPRSQSVSPSPAPGSYNVGVSIGHDAPKITIQNRHLDIKLVKESVFMPGPDSYNTAGITGATLPRIQLAGRLPQQDDIRQAGPGPAQYNVPNTFDKYNLIPAGWILPFVRGFEHSSNGSDMIGD